MWYQWKFLNIIIDIYSKVNYSVKLPLGPEEFSSFSGVKQGCVLSPILFNLFLNDLPSIFDNKCDPCKLQDIDINCLLYADDLVLISQSQDSLQNALDHLDGYCRKWKLTINTTKTKPIIFNKSGKIFKKTAKRHLSPTLSSFTLLCYKEQQLLDSSPFRDTHFMQLTRTRFLATQLITRRHPSLN